MKIIISPGSVVPYNPFFKHFITEMKALGNEVLAPRLQYLISADVFHVHFPEHKVSVNKNFLRAVGTASAMLGFMFTLKLRGRPIVWMVHEVSPLQGFHPRLHRAYMAFVRKVVSGYIFLSKSSRSEFERLYPEQRKKPILEISHPPYSVNLLKTEDKIALREKLGVKPDEFLIGYLGDIRAYKNPEILRHIPEQLDDGRKTVLLVAGRPNEETKDYKKYIMNHRHIHIDKRLSDEELESLIQAADVVLLPYLRIWNSGFLFLVLSCQQKCVTSNLPVFVEMKEIFGNSWITTFDLSAAEPRNAISRSINDAAKIIPSKTEIKQLTMQMEGASFDRLAANVQTFYMSLNFD